MKSINILLFLSDYKNLASDNNPKGAKEEEYTLEGTMRKYSGTQTNDVPIKYMFEQAKSNNAYIKRVISITSHKVLTQPEAYPQIDRFQSFIETIKKENEMDNDIEYIQIPYDYEEKTKEEITIRTELPGLIYGKLSHCFNHIDESEEVYIDYTGGLRDISFLMTSIIRFLEFRGLKCGEIVYSNFFDKKLFDIHYIYDIYRKRSITGCL